MVGIKMAHPYPPYFKKEDIVLIPTEKLICSHGAFFELQKLADDIRKNGLNDPLIVERNGDFYKVIDGNHRFIVLKMLGWKEIPCFVV